jgi:hypothetical protein
VPGHRRRIRLRQEHARPHRSRLRSAELGPTVLDCGNALVVANGYPMRFRHSPERFEPWHPGRAGRVRRQRLALPVRESLLRALVRQAGDRDLARTLCERARRPALEQGHALERFDLWIVADEVYGRGPALREAAEKLGKGYVLAVPSTFTIDLGPPGVSVGIGGTTLTPGIQEVGHSRFADSQLWSAKVMEVDEDGSFYVFGGDMTRALDVWRFDADAAVASDGGRWLAATAATGLPAGGALEAGYTPYCLLPPAT